MHFVYSVLTIISCPHNPSYIFHILLYLLLAREIWLSLNARNKFRIKINFSYNHCGKLNISKAN